MIVLILPLFADSKVFIPVLKDFFQKHPLINPKIFLGDAAFDSVEIYKYLLQETSIGKAYIPLYLSKDYLLKRIIIQNNNVSHLNIFCYNHFILKCI